MQFLHSTYCTSMQASQPHAPLLHLFSACAAQALSRSKLKADRNEGILGRIQDNVCIKRHGTVKQLLHLVEEKGFVLLKAPPRSGKTSLLQLLEMSYPRVRDPG